MFAAALVLQAGVFTVFAETVEEEGQNVTVSEIDLSMFEEETASFEAETETQELPSDEIETETLELPSEEIETETQELSPEENETETQELPSEENETETQELPPEENETETQELPPEENETETQEFSSDEAETADEEKTVLRERVFSRENIKILGGNYSYKLVLREDGTLTFDNDLEISYQGINGWYQLNYEIEKNENHIMIVTGYFENIITESPLLKLFSDQNKNWILSHITEDSYYYQLDLRTKEGFTFKNILKFLFNSRQYGYTINFSYDLTTKKQALDIKGIE